MQPSAGGETLNLVETERFGADRELVRHYLATGSDEAFRRLYQAHAPALFGVALRLSGGERSDAEDTFQEAWLRASRSLSGFRWESSLRTWLVGILVRCAHERLRRNGRQLVPDAEVPEPSVPFATPMVDLDRAVAALPDGYRVVLVLHDIEGHTHQEIGRMLGIEPGTSKSQLSRARRMLRLWMEQDGKVRNMRI